MLYCRRVANAFYKTKKNKYGAVKTLAHGILFDSKLEATEYLKLYSRKQAGEISDLQLQVIYRLEHSGKLICKYIADFVYTENGKTIVADAKGRRTSTYQLKKKLMKIILGIQILELCAPKRNKKPVAVKAKKAKSSAKPADDFELVLWE